MARRDDLAKLRGLAGERGYTIERAYRRNCWRLLDAAGKPAINPHDGSIAFTVARAIAFLADRKRPAENVRGKPRRTR